MKRTPHLSLLTIAALFLATISPAHSCSLIPGYFYQLTSLEGRVVGTQNFFVQNFPWLRQSLGRNHAEPTLYQ